MSNDKSQTQSTEKPTMQPPAGDRAPGWFLLENLGNPAYQIWAQWDGSMWLDSRGNPGEPLGYRIMWREDSSL